MYYIPTLCTNKYCKLYILGSMHRDCVLIRCNSMQVFIYCKFTCFGRPSCPPSGAQKAVTAASGTGRK